MGKRKGVCRFTNRKKMNAVLVACLAVASVGAADVQKVRFFCS